MPGDNVSALSFSAVSDRYPWHAALWSSLSRQIDQLPHALLLQGRPGLGKHDFAVQVAQRLLCIRPQAELACGQCHSCQLFSAGNHPDLSGVGLLEDAKTITVDQIRALGEFLALRPHTGTRKVVIISPAEAMNLNAANSLLKLLEEPPLGSVLLLVASHPARLPATVRSRCSRVLFRSPPMGEAQAWLQARSGEASASAARLLDVAGGAPLLAYSLAQDGFPELRAKLLQDLLAISHGREQPVACAARWKGKGARQILGWLQAVAADWIKFQLQGSGAGLLNPEIAGECEKYKFKINDLYNFIDVIHDYYRQINSPLDELLMLESILIRWSRLRRLQ